MSAVPAYTRAAERAPERYPERPRISVVPGGKPHVETLSPGDRRSPEWWRQPAVLALVAFARIAYCRRRQCRNRVEELRQPYRHRALRGSSSRWRRAAFQSLRISLGRPPLAWLRQVDRKSCCPKTSSRPTARAISRFPRVWPPPRGASGRIWPTADATCATGIIPAGAKRGGRILLAARDDRLALARRAGTPPVRASARIAGPPHHALHVHRARRARRGRLAMREARAVSAMSVPLAGRLLPKARFPASSAPLVPSAAPLGERLAALPSASAQAIPPR